MLNPALFKLSSDLCTVNAETRSMYVHISDIGEPRGKSDILLGRVFDDACDVGFILHSVKTNQDHLFVWSYDMKTADGEVFAMKFVSADLIGGPPSKTCNGRGAKCKAKDHGHYWYLTVYND